MPKTKSSNGEGRVCAIVVTFNRRDLLRKCLGTLQGQTRRVDTILIVDNASTDGTSEMLAADFAELPVLALPHNVGGAGGFHAGMKWAFEKGFDWLWLMDDDGTPAPDCLETLLAHRPDNGTNAVLVPPQQNSGGGFYGVGLWPGREVEVAPRIVQGGQAVRGRFIFRFVGPLIGRAIVGQVGLPEKDFFIWFDDHEYALRIHKKTKAHIIVVPDAIFQHDFGGVLREVSVLGRRSFRAQQPAWKNYYGARNSLYVLVRRGNLRELMWYFYVQLRWLAGDIAHEADRGERVKMRLTGMRDGLLGRLGKREF